MRYRVTYLRYRVILSLPITSKSYRVTENIIIL